MLSLPRPLWTSTKAPRRVARPNLRDFGGVVPPTSLITSLAHLSVFLLSPFPVSKSMAPSWGMSAWLGRLEFPLLMSVTCLSGPVHNSPFVFPKC